MKLSMILVRLCRFGTVRERCAHWGQDFCLNSLPSPSSCLDPVLSWCSFGSGPSLFFAAPPFTLSNPCYNPHR